MLIITVAGCVTGQGVTARMAGTVFVSNLKKKNVTVCFCFLLLRVSSVEDANMVTC